MKEVTIGGNQYKLAPITIRDYQEIADEYREQTPDPVKLLLATANDLPESMRDQFIRDHLDEAFAEKKKRGALNDEGFREYLESGEGVSKLLARSIRKHHSNLTDDQAADLMAEGVAEHGESFLAGVFPQAAKGADVRGRGGKGVPGKSARTTA
jgi:hypothetical protein